MDNIESWQQDAMAFDSEVVSLPSVYGAHKMYHPVFLDKTIVLVDLHVGQVAFRVYLPDGQRSRKVIS